MRVTNNMIQYGSLNALYNNTEQLDTLFTQMSTLKKIDSPSDDPIIAGRALKLRIDVNEAGQFEENTKEALSWMEVSDGAISNIEDILKGIKTRLNQASTSTLTQEDKEKILADINQLSEQIKDELNTSYAGRHVFSGYKIDQPVYFDVDTVLENDTSNVLDIKLSKDMTVGAGGLTINKDMVLAEDMLVGPGMLVTGSTSYAEGDVIPAGTTITAPTTFPEGAVIPADTFIPAQTDFTAGTTIPGGTANPDVVGKTQGQDIKYEIGSGIQLEINETKLSDIFVGNYEKVIEDILNAVENDDEEKLSALIEDVDSVMSDISERMADGGSRQVRLEMTSIQMADEQTTFTELLSETEDIDLEEVYVQYSSQMMVYQSALKASSQVVVNTLADYI
ncbi:flagellar hook-associated protein 3 [Candidatus Epulonipiscioides gigas]|nr:flagellar hook-associated protein 3 [Epulopiscium sp. SCG-C07WGA-EpuloA2]